MDKSFDDGEEVDHWYNLSAIDVKTDKATPVVAILGLITDGRGSTTNHQNRWTDFLSDALNAEKPYGVLNLGIRWQLRSGGRIERTSHEAFRP